MTGNSMLTLIALLALSNFAVRALPVRLLSGRELPPFFVTWLRYVPVPVLSAMLASEILVRQGRLALGPANLSLWVAVPTFFVAGVTRNLYLTVIAGMALLAGARWGVPYLA